MSRQHEFIARMKAQLDEWTAELHALDLKAGNAGEDARAKFRQASKELHEKRVAAETKLEEIRHAGEETWGDLREEAERTWAAFKAGVDAFRDFSDHS